VAVPAATAGLAYLNAKLQVSNDFHIISSFISGSIRCSIRERRDTLNLFNLLEYQALNKKSADHTWINYEGREWTFKESYETVLRYGQWLKYTHKVEKGQIVALDCMNSSTYVWIWFGLWSIGAKPAFINYNLTGDPLLHCVKTSTAQLLVADEEIRYNFTSDVLDTLSSRGVRTVFLTPDVLSAAESMSPKREPDEVRSGAKLNEMALLIYTSGTTGLPKPGIVSWAKVSLAGFFASRWLRVKPTDRFYTCMPLYHSSAAVLGLCSTLNAGCTLLIGHKFSTKTFWPEVKAGNATIIQYVGEMCRYLLSAPAAASTSASSEDESDPDKQHSVRMAFGNGLRPDVWTRFQTRFNIPAIAEIYAATEGPSGMWNLSRNAFSAGAVGHNGKFARLMFHSQISVVKPDADADSAMPFREPSSGFCVEAAPGEVGELLYKLDPADLQKKFQGYFGDSAASEKKVLRNVHRQGDAWFRSGDLLYYDEEGRWFFSDRIGDTFRWKSENVSTSEVAGIVGLHPAIQEANVYGVALPNHDGRAGCAAVLLNPGHGQGFSGVARELAEWVKGRLPRYAVPIFMRVSEVSRLTGTMKLQKNVLRDEGVDPMKVAKEGDVLYWLKPGAETYVKFEQADWDGVVGGSVRL
jgi:acyl-CoA synthetase (AMP-forming)/AMP-acid ligase II